LPQMGMACQQGLIALAQQKIDFCRGVMLFELLNQRCSEYYIPDESGLDD